MFVQVAFVQPRLIARVEFMFEGARDSFSATRLATFLLDNNCS
jgi:hypothetical protein